MTPAIVYDLENLDRSLSILQEDIGKVRNAKLNFAVKACHTPQILEFLARKGLGADVASMGEFHLARDAGFREITATGPSFTSAEAIELAGFGMAVDASSIDQLQAFWESEPNLDVGIRLRIPLPDHIDDRTTTFGTNSRFGILPADHKLQNLDHENSGKIIRLHTHTGQMTPEHLLYKAKVLLATATFYKGVRSIDFGGGFFSLYVSRSRAISALQELNSMVESWVAQNDRDIEIVFEPGAATLGSHGYLVTEVTATEDNHSGFGCNVATLNASSWNLTPWHLPKVFKLGSLSTESAKSPYLLAGNTLYENDFFGSDLFGKRKLFQVSKLSVHDKVVFTNSGAYTMTNSRDFNRIPKPKEYIFSERETTFIK
ncbi:hypothetical protein AOZ07_01510 [Glutamicibacter halophytocola]|nr:hypothetical protein AOZ07_01510 [Glutamicibacter halophytocola]